MHMEVKKSRFTKISNFEEIDMSARQVIILRGIGKYDAKVYLDGARALGRACGRL